MCRCPYPKDAMTVVMKLGNRLAKFESILDVTVHAAIPTGGEEDDESEVHYEDHSTEIELKIPRQEVSISDDITLYFNRFKV